MSLVSLLVIVIASFLLLMIIFVLGRLKVKTLHLSLLVGLSIFVIILLALYINDSKLQLFSFILSGTIAVFFSCVIYFALNIIRRIKG